MNTVSAYMYKRPDTHTKCGRRHIQMQLIMYYRRITEEHCELNAINVENKTILKKGKKYKFIT